MKKRLLTIVILLVLFLTACAGRTAGADDAERLPAESVTMLDEGVWPVNAYTEGLPVPPGTVTWAYLRRRKCCVHNPIRRWRRRPAVLWRGYCRR